MAMLGGLCSPCCNGGVGCDCSVGGTFPAIPSDDTKGLVWLEFSSCIGSGATATVDAPAAASPCDYEGMAGPISGATITNNGSGYARLGRVEPTITASVSGGSSATLAITLSQESEYLGDNCMEVPWWAVQSVSVTAGGSGYSDGAAVTFSAASGDTVVSHAKAYAYVVIDSPQNETVSITTTGGTSATLVPTWSALPPGAPYATRPGGTNPPFCGKPDRTTYEVSGWTISAAGTGYAVGDFVEITFATDADGQVVSAGSFEVTQVGGSGEIQAVTVNNGGSYGGSLTGELSEVVVESCVLGGNGKYYREDASEPPYVATVTVTVHQEAPSTGSGAVITATVEDDTASSDFGKVVSLTVDDGGTGYLSPPLACDIPDTLYITWGALSVSIPARFDLAPGVDPPWQPLGGAYDTICGSYFSVNDGEGDPYCRGGVVNPFPGDAGNLTELAVGYAIEPGLECKCGGKLTVRLVLGFVCQECVATNSGPPGQEVATVEVAQNKSRVREACFRFEVDEEGCPVGDAVLVSWIDGEMNVFCAEPCDCLDDCDDRILPQISFLP